MGVPITHVPAQGILDRLYKTLGELEWLADQVRIEGGPNADALFRGTRYVRRVEGPDGTVVTSEAGPGMSERLKTYLAWNRLYLAQVQVALTHEVSERQLAAAEREAEVYGQLLAAALDALGVTGEDQRRTAFGAARDRFAVLHGGAA
jgi:hypothetical protein